MKKKLIIIAILIVLSLSLTAFAQKPNTCLSCHKEMSDEMQKPALLIIDDIHHKIGLSCAGCHGGDPSQEDAEMAMSPAKGFVGVPGELEIPQFCGKCHSDPKFMRNYDPALPTDQLEKYRTSMHGQRIQQKDKKAAQCVSCHSVHDIREAENPQSSVYAENVPATCAKCHADSSYMAEYGIPVNQFDNYKQSVHGNALLLKHDTGAPACNDCHGNHAAMPPGVTALGAVCYQCHAAEGELFLASPHKPAFDMMGEAECVYCHSNHKVLKPSDELIGTEKTAICVNCHSEGDAGYNAAKAMKEAIVSLHNKYSASKELLDDAEQKGVEVSEEQFALRGIHDRLLQMRKLIHAFDPQKSAAAADTALKAADDVNKAGLAAVKEVSSRRYYFLIFTALTLFLAVVLVMKIKSYGK